MIKFLSIHIQGFGSISRPFSFSLNQAGINVISARNGIGKTTIFSALYWALYGKTLKNKSTVQTWEDKRHKGFKGTRVAVNFIKGTTKYKVISHEDFKGQKSKLILIENGAERNDLRDKNDIRKEIINILGYTPELFKNSIIFGQKMKRIIEEDGPMKKKIFDDIFDIGYLKVAKDKAEAKLNELNIEHDNLIRKTDNVGEIILILKQELTTTKKNKANARITKLRTIGNLTKMKNGKVHELNKLGLKLSDRLLSQLEKQLEKLRAKELKVKQWQGTKFKLEFLIDGFKGDRDNELEFQKNLIKPIKFCPRCGQKILDKKKEKLHIASEIKASKARIYAANENLILPNNQLFQINRRLEKYKHLYDQVNQLRNKIQLESDKKKQVTTLKKDIENINKQINQVREQKLIFNTNLIKKRLDVRLKEQAGIITESAFYQKEIDLYKWLIKDPLSNSGIKAYIFDSMLEVINNKLTQYSNQVGFKIKMGIDLLSGNKDFFILIESRGHSRRYEDLSGGQQQLVNVCIAFAVHDVVSLEKACNLLVFDEIFENLDSENIEVISNLISQKAHGKSTYIITHHTEFNPVNANIIRLRNRKGNTSLE